MGKQRRCRHQLEADVNAQLSINIGGEPCKLTFAANAKKRRDEGWRAALAGGIAHIIFRVGDYGVNENKSALATCVVEAFAVTKSGGS